MILPQKSATIWHITTELEDSFVSVYVYGFINWYNCCVYWSPFILLTTGYFPNCCESLDIVRAKSTISFVFVSRIYRLYTTIVLAYSAVIQNLCLSFTFSLLSRSVVSVPLYPSARSVTLLHNMQNKWIKMSAVKKNINLCDSHAYDFFVTSCFIFFNILYMSF